MALTSNNNDTDNVLLYKLAVNLYEAAVAAGIAGAIAPNRSDFDYNLLYNATYNSALLADNA